MSQPAHLKCFNAEDIIHAIQLKLIQVRTYIMKFLGIVVKSFSELVMEFIFVLAISVILCYIF